MPHHIYHTRGIVIGSVPTGESNRFYKIFTEELGLVNAAAQSVREGKSKLRYVLQDFSFVTLDLVRGKEVWRITSAGEWRDLAGIKSEQKKLKIFARYCTLLSRLLQGEGREQELFYDGVSLVNFLEKTTMPDDFVLSLETLVALRVLVRLGYLDPSGYEAFLREGVLNEEILENFEMVRIESLVKINEALRVSHL